MKVYIVQHGELNEGSEVVSVHANREDAVKAALAQRCCFDGGWVPDDDHSWINGCDFVLVDEQEVL